MKNSLEQVWKEEARKAYRDQQSQDNEGGCREPVGFVQGYLAAKKSDFEKIAELEKLSEMQARDAFSRYEEIKTLKEQLAEAVEILKMSLLRNRDSGIYFNDVDLFIKSLEKQDKENKDVK